MKRPLLGAALICSCVVPAVAEQVLAVGTMVKLSADNVYYGCYDVENAKAVEGIRAEGGASASAYGRGVQAVAQFVREHSVGLSPHKPSYFSDVCVRLPADINWKVVRIYDWPGGGGPQLACLAPMKKFDLGPQAGTPPDEPSCWWTNLYIE